MVWLLETDTQSKTAVTASVNISLLHMVIFLYLIQSNLEYQTSPLTINVLVINLSKLQLTFSYFEGKPLLIHVIIYASIKCGINCSWIVLYKDRSNIMWYLSSSLFRQFQQNRYSGNVKGLVHCLAVICNVTDLVKAVRWDFAYKAIDDWFNSKLLSPQC